MQPALPITRTKVILPRRRDEIIRRQRLLHILEEAQDKRLFIVAAPAGYGKTSLLLDFAHQSALPVGWLALDSLDQDPQRMIAHFIAAVRQIFPEFGKTCMAALEGMSQDRLNMDALVSLVVNDAYDTISEHFIVILDDYHLVEDNPEINYFINRFLMQVDENCHLVISSRRLLPLADMPLLVARGQVGGLGFEELAFNTEEIKDLYLQNHHVSLSEREAGDLSHLTEGWITGLILSTQIQGGKVLRQNQVKKVAGVGLYEYLAQQVLERQSEALQSFLLRTSLLEEFDAELCEKVIGQALEQSLDWATLMAQVQRRNLFVLPVVEDKVWLRYHHLFRDFLQSRMLEGFPEETRKIQARLAEYYTQAGNWELAYQVYQRIGNQDELARLIEISGPALISRGRLITLNQWLNELPPPYLERSAKLLSLSGATNVMLGDPKKGIKILSHALQSLQIGDDEEVLAHTYVRRSSAFRMIGDSQRALEDADKAIEICKNRSTFEWLKAGAYYSKGTAFHLNGNLNDALDCLSLARKSFLTTGDLESAFKSAMEIALVSRHLGQSQAAEDSYREALNYYQSTGNIVWQAHLLNNLGVLHSIAGEYEYALNELEHSIEYARLGGYLRLEGYALVSLGDLFKDIQASAEAEEAYHKAKAILDQINDQPLEIYLKLSLGELALERGKIVQTKELIKASQEIARETDSEYEINMCKIAKAKLAFFQQDMAVVFQELSSAYEFFDREGHQVEAGKCQLFLGLAHYACGEFEAGRKYLATVLVSFREGKMRSLLAGTRQPLELTLQKLRQTGLEDAAFPIPVVELKDHVDTFEQRQPLLRKRLRKQSQIVPLSAPELTILTFGKIQIKIGDHVISGMEWKSQTARDLLLLLLLRPEGMTKEEIGMIYWPDSSPEELKVRFKNTIYRLRHAAGKDVILFEDDIYTFNRGMDYEADFETFVREIELATATTNNVSQIQHYQAALRVYKGAFLPDLFEEWALTERERYLQMFLAGAIKLAELYMEQGEYNSAVEVAGQLLHEDRCNEHMVRIAMRSYAALGNRTAAVRQYEEFTRALKKEFGTQPSAQTVSLYQTLSKAKRARRQQSRRMNP